MSNFRVRGQLAKNVSFFCPYTLDLHATKAFRFVCAPVFKCVNLTPASRKWFDDPFPFDLCSAIFFLYNKKPHACILLWLLADSFDLCQN